MVLVDWEHGEFAEDGLELDAAHLALKKTLGLPPYSLSSVRMRVEINHDSFREDLFQTMSSSLWANSGDLYVAGSIDDESLGDQVRRLANQLGIGVVSFGLKFKMPWSAKLKLSWAASRWKKCPLPKNGLIVAGNPSKLSVMTTPR